MALLGVLGALAVPAHRAHETRAIFASFPPYPPSPMFGRFIRRVAETIVLLLAAYAFFRVPVGEKTSFQHLVAIFSTDTAREAAREYKAVGEQIKNEIVEQVRAKAAPSEEEEDAGAIVDASDPDA